MSVCVCTSVHMSVLCTWVCVYVCVCVPWCVCVSFVCVSQVCPCVSELCVCVSQVCAGPQRPAFQWCNPDPLIRSRCSSSPQT